MFEAQKAKISFVVGLAISGVHYGSHAVVWTENYLLEKYANVENKVVNAIATKSGFVPFKREKDWQEIADEEAERQGVNKCLVRAVIKVESVDGKFLVSKAGALGHMQVMRDTARRACGLERDSERLEPRLNIGCGVKVLAQNIKQYGLTKGLKVYNAGPTRIDMTKENQEYPGKILEAWSQCNV